MRSARRDDARDPRLPGRAFAARARNGRDALGLADDAQVLGPVLAVVRAALDEHRLLDAVARIGIAP